MRRDLILIGMGGVVMGLIMLLYIISILQKVTTEYRFDLPVFSHKKTTLRTIQVLTTGFGFYAAGMLLGGVGMVYEAPNLTKISRFVSGIGLFGFIYFLHKFYTEEL